MTFKEIAKYKLDSRLKMEIFLKYISEGKTIGWAVTKTNEFILDKLAMTQHND